MEFQIILMTIIAFSAVLTVLSVIFNWLLSPVKESITEIKLELRDLKQILMDKKINE